MHCYDFCNWAVRPLWFTLPCKESIVQNVKLGIICELPGIKDNPLHSNDYNSSVVRRNVNDNLQSYGCGKGWFRTKSVCFRTFSFWNILTFESYHNVCESDYLPFTILPQNPVSCISKHYLNILGIV